MFAQMIMQSELPVLMQISDSHNNRIYSKVLSIFCANIGDAQSCIQESASTASIHRP